MLCVAGGPSLDRDRIARLAGRCRAITINGRVDGERPEYGCPWADVLYGADAAWWRKAQGGAGFEGLKVALQENEFRAVKVLHHDHAPGLSFDPGTLHTGSNSGYQAINLAVLLGAKRIVLAGYDMKPAPDGKLHWHGSHRPEDGLRNPEPSRSFANWIAAFETMMPDLAKAGVDVINATPGSALTCFPMAELEDVI